MSSTATSFIESAELSLIDTFCLFLTDELRELIFFLELEAADLLDWNILLSITTSPLEMKWDLPLPLFWDDLLLSF